MSRGFPVQDPAAEQTGETAEDGDLDILRAKYLDYCSAQLADVLLYLSPDEIFLLAERTSHEGGGAGEASYAEMVARATEWLSRKVSLPPFEIWLEDYRANPEVYEGSLMGLWESELRKRHSD